MLNGYLPFDESRIGDMQERMRTQRFTFVRGLSHEPRLHGGYSRFPPKLIERAQRLSYAINLRHRSLRRCSVEQDSGGGSRRSLDGGGSLGQSASENVAAEDSGRMVSKDVSAPEIVYEGPNGCLYSVIDPGDVPPKKRSEWPVHAERTHTGRPSGEAEELSNGAQTTSVELTELPSQTRRLPPGFPSTGSTVSAYGLRGNKLLTTIHDPNYGQVTLPEIQENNLTIPASFTQQLALHYRRYARKPSKGPGDDESCDRRSSVQATPSCETSVPSLVPRVKSSASTKHFDMATLSMTRKQTAGGHENGYTETCVPENLPPVFHNMFPKWKKACRK
ncbi:hypothetical protein NP493_12g02026 [Ridgeia piscesae]|uniref:Uncharacterized protein n=1 Tax=Ridgeia piscesae TaxID=27915 RepID=A0AAD9PEY8_RIDPI|nr:hypothetical protein NP493_12g02026 [Ridgeia piscesae]